MEKLVTYSNRGDDITLEELSLEPHVVRRKRSLVSVLKRRLVQSLNEVEVCTYQDEDEEKVNGTELHQCEYLRNAKSNVPHQRRDRCEQKRRASFHFCSTKEISYLYCQNNSPFQFYPLFMSFADGHRIHQLSKMKYNTLV